MPCAESAVSDNCLPDLDTERSPSARFGRLPRRLRHPQVAQRVHSGRADRTTNAWAAFVRRALTSELHLPECPAQSARHDSALSCGCRVRYHCDPSSNQRSAFAWMADDGLGVWQAVAVNTGMNCPLSPARIAHMGGAL
jgi:hypothetical protein